MTRSAWLAAHTLRQPRCEAWWQNGAVEWERRFSEGRGGVTVGLGDRAEFVGRNGLRILAGDESGFGGGAGFGEQGQWVGAAFDRARFHAIRAVADAMRVAVQDPQRGEAFASVNAVQRRRGGEQPSVR